MRKYKLFLIGLMFIVFGSCNSNRIFEDHLDLSAGLEWQQSQKLKYTFNIDQAPKDYRIVIALRYITGFQFQDMRVKMTIKSPSGKLAEKEYTMRVIDENKEYLGDGAGDIWDLEVPAEENYHFEEVGSYAIEIEHAMPVDPVPNVMEFGVIIEKTGQE